MSVLIHKLLNFQELMSVIDVESTYVFLYCRIHAITCILAVMYAPPFSKVVLRELVTFLLNKPDVHFIVVWDFNSYLNPTTDKHPSHY